MRDGDVWEQLELLIKLKGVDLVVVGTHGRAGLGKLLLGSVAERVFRHADCFVATVGPGSYEDSLFERDNAGHTFLFATDFGAASLQALPYALSLASQFEAKLVVLHVLPAVPISEGFHWSKTGDLVQMREKAKADAQEKFEGAIYKRHEWHSGLNLQSGSEYRVTRSCWPLRPSGLISSFWVSAALQEFRQRRTCLGTPLTR